MSEQGRALAAGGIGDEYLEIFSSRTVEVLRIGEVPVQHVVKGIGQIFFPIHPVSQGTPVSRPATDFV